MIIEALTVVVVTILQGVMFLLPNLSAIQIPTGFIEWFMNIVNASSYFLPLTDFFIMMGIWFAVINFQIIWKTLQRIWDALPFT